MIAAIAATREICERKLVRPSVSVLRIMMLSGLKSVFAGLTSFILQRYHTASPVVTICPITVATAAPIMPHLKAKMNIGSSIIFSTAPASVETIANFGLPSARITGFIACPNI